MLEIYGTSKQFWVGYTKMNKMSESMCVLKSTLRVVGPLEISLLESQHDVMLLSTETPPSPL